MSTVLTHKTGQVEYIFSDKTGTLTCNEMEFKRASINGVVYGKHYEDDQRGKDMCEGDEQLMRTMLSEMGAKYIGEEQFAFVDPEILRDIKTESGQSLAIRQFFILLALCHTVLAETFEDDPNMLFYKSQSPDEGALVEAARNLGFAFLRRQQNKIFLSIFGEEKEFNIQHVIEFNSDRKRMSVIIKTPGTVKMPEGDVLLLCKGADSIIYERLSPMNDKRLTDLTLSQLESFADKGLRTLCLAYRHISREEYEPWAAKYLNAQAALADREKLMATVAEEIEKDLMLMGATAIEDKLQEGVPRCIDDLARAGIKIWVLTVS
jgi:phospholipid-translocating ATPase